MFWPEYVLQAFTTKIGYQGMFQREDNILVSRDLHTLLSQLRPTKTRGDCVRSSPLQELMTRLVNRWRGLDFGGNPP